MEVSSNFSRCFRNDEGDSSLPQIKVEDHFCRTGTVTVTGFFFFFLRRLLCDTSSLEPEVLRTSKVQWET